MKYVALALIWAYRKMLRPFYVRYCIFAESCSHCVERTIRERGVIVGLGALRARFLQCRPGWRVNTDGQSFTCVDGTIYDIELLSAFAREEHRNSSTHQYGSNN